MKRYRWDKKYLYWGVTAFLVIAACILFYLIANNLGWLGAALKQLGNILSPFIWGLVIAYLLYPLMKIYQRHLFTPLAKLIFRRSAKAEERVPKLARGLAVFLSIISLLVIVGGMIWLVAPQLVSSIERIVVNSGDYIAAADAWLTRVLSDYPELEQAISGAVGDLSNGLVTWATSTLLPMLKDIATNVTVNVYYFFKGVYNVIIGIIVSVYVLYSRETFASHCKKIIYCIFSLEASEKILKGVQFTNQVFIGFLSGKILDSLIIGILCYAGCMILRMPYALLVSVIVGVTNVIPFFGPLFGMIPGTLIIMMESPLKALIFLVFIILLQQFDGNILGPKILGNKVGINGFWVMFSIIFGAGLFGFAGMLLGVPVFVVIYSFFKNLVNKKLGRSGLPTDSAEYRELDYFDPKTGARVEKSERPKPPKKPFAWPWKKKTPPAEEPKEDAPQEEKKEE